MTTTITAVIKNPFTGVSGSPVSLKNNLASVSQNYIHNLLDVVEINPVDGATLVYNATTDKYEVKQITVSATSLDGGSF
jgi:hypothetical protein